MALLEVRVTYASSLKLATMPLGMVLNKSQVLESVHQQLEVVAVLLLEPQPHLIVLQVTVNIKLMPVTQ